MEYHIDSYHMKKVLKILHKNRYESRKKKSISKQYMFQS